MCFAQSLLIPNAASSRMSLLRRQVVELLSGHSGSLLLKKGTKLTNSTFL
jgi:hypothetical protein